MYTTFSTPTLLSSSRTPSAGRTAPVSYTHLKAVEEIFGVKVLKVNTVSMKGQKRRMGRNEGYTSDWKKAIVTLTADSKTIEFFDGMF